MIKCKFWNSKSLNPYAEELTVFINVNTASLNEYSKLIPLKDKKIVNEKSEIIKITIVRKYLFISWVAKLILENTSLFINTFFGLLKESIWFTEYLVNEYIFKNLRPELVEINEPPIITKSKYKNWRLVCSTFNEIPILEILLTNDKKL